MRLSVIVPFYNVEKYIEKCVRSLFEQTYKDMEIIFVDDGGNDHSLDILNKLINEYSYTECKIIHKINAGLPQARKTGVEYAAGEYIAFVDSDDWLEPDFYENCMSYVENNDSILYCTGYQKSFDNGNDIIFDYIKSAQNISVDTFVELVHQRKLFHTMWSKIFRRDAFDMICFPKGNFLGEDYVTLLPFVRKIENVFLIPEYGYHYRQLSNSMGNGAFNNNKRKGFIALHKIYPYICQWYPESIESINCFYAIEYMAVITAMGKNSIFENKIVRFIQMFLRNKVFTMIKADYVDFKFKASLLVIIFIPHFFSMIYSIPQKICHKEYGLIFKWTTI